MKTERANDVDDWFLDNWSFLPDGRPIAFRKMVESLVIISLDTLDTYILMRDDILVLS